MRHGGIVTIKIINMTIKNCVDDDRKLSEPARSTLAYLAKMFVKFTIIHISKSFPSMFDHYLILSRSCSCFVM